MKKIFLSLIVLLFGCNYPTYKYVIYMKDGNQVKAWEVYNEGGGVTVYEKKGHYYLSSHEYTKVIYVGPKKD